MLEEAELLAGVFGYPRLILTRGEGSWVWDKDERKYLDFTAGLGVLALGHGRADLAQVLAEQFTKLGHCSNLFGNEPVLELAAKLKRASFASRVWFANSGTEANEAAMKFARLFGRAAHPKKSSFIAFRGGFHGRTLGALAATYHPSYRKPFAPLVPGMRFADFNDIASVREVLDEDVCAVIVEPVQGEGGVVQASREFLAGLRALCDASGALLVFDEVQCGYGRTGHLFAYQGYGVVPDMVTLAKPMANGLPIGAVLLNQRVAQVLAVGHHGSTFAGGPAVCAVATKVLDAIGAPEFLASVKQSGQHLARGLDELCAEHVLFGGARGRGLMQGLVVADPHRHAPARIVDRARERGLLITRAGDAVVRLLPPLNVTTDEIDLALATLHDVARELETSSKRKRAMPTVGEGAR